MNKVTKKFAIIIPGTFITGSGQGTAFTLGAAFGSNRLLIIADRAMARSYADNLHHYWRTPLEDIYIVEGGIKFDEARYAASPIVIMTPGMLIGLKVIDSFDRVVWFCNRDPERALNLTATQQQIFSKLLRWRDAK